MLSKANIPILFSGGLDQSRPEKLVVPGSFIALENCIRRKEGQVEKRYGFSSLGKTVLPDASGNPPAITDGHTMATFRDDVLLFSSTNLFSYVSGSDAWVSKGLVTNTSLTSTPVVRNGNIQAMPDMATNGGLTATIWEDSAGGVYYSIYNDATGSSITADRIMAVFGSRPRVIAIGPYFIFTWYEAASIVSRRVSIYSPNDLLGPHTVQGAVVADKPFDMCEFGSFGLFVFNNTSGGITLGYLTQMGTAGSIVGNGLPDPVSLAVDATNCLTIVGDLPNNLLYIVYHDGTDVQGLSYVASTLGLHDASPIETIANVRNATGTMVGNTLRIYYEVSNADVKKTRVRTNTYSWFGFTPVVGTAAPFKRSVGLISKAFTVGGVPYVSVTHESQLQPTYFVVRQDGIIVAKMAPAFGGGLTRNSANPRALKSGLPRVSLNADNEYVSAIQIRNELETESNGTILSTQVGINKFAIDFNSQSFRSTTLGDNLHISGGIVQAYDGAAAAEHGFNVFPEDLTEVAAAGGSLPAGDYYYQVVYEWVDGKGQIHHSAPSITRRVTGVTLNQKITVTIPTLRLTAKATVIKIVVYVAAVDLSVVFYRHGTVDNNTAVDTVNYAILTPAVVTNEVLYTVGGIYENIAAPAAGVIHQHKNRVWIGDLEDGSLGYSKEFVSGEGVAFTDFFRIPMESEGGRVRALATLDDKLVIFKQDRCYYLPGDGPLDTGAQNDYPRPIVIASDVGTTIPESVVETPLGIFFKSSKGIYLLTRGLQIKFIGIGVQNPALNNLTISSAVVVADDNEVRFTTSDGVDLVYNWSYEQWSTFTNYEAVSGIIGLGSYLHLKADGTVNREIVGSYLDNGSRVIMGIETSWLSLAQVQGFQRIYRILFLGDFVSHHYTKLKVAYDFENTYTETVYFDTRTGLVSSNVFGAGTPFGEDDPFGGEGSSVYQFRFRPGRQKCESVKVRLEDIDTITSDGGGSFKLVAMNAEVGRKSGAYRLPQRKTIGSI